MGRLLNYTQDLAPNQFITPLKNIPIWAEQEVNYVHNKFGKLVPYYFDSFNPKQPVKKDTVVKFINAYLDFNNEDSSKNAKLNFDITFYNEDAGYDFLINYGILPNTARDTLTKQEVATALLKASDIKEERLDYLKQNQAVAKKQSLQQKAVQPKPVVEVAKQEDNTKKVSVANKNLLLEGSVGMSNLYIWRGMTQANSGDSAIYGALDTLLNDNIAVGTFISNVGFSDDTSYEWDLYASYSDSVAFFPNYSYELGFIYYAYPNSQSTSSIDFSEVYASISNDSISLSLFTLVSGPNNAAVANDNYLNFQYVTPIMQNFNFTASLGYYNGSTMITGEQLDYMLSISKNGFTFATIGTDNTEQKPIMQIKYEYSVF